MSTLLPTYSPLLYVLLTHLCGRCPDKRQFTGNAVNTELLLIIETPFAIISACLPCSLHVLKLAATHISRLLTSLRGLSESMIPTHTAAMSQGQSRNIGMHNTGNFVQLQGTPLADVSTSTPPRKTTGKADLYLSR